MRRVFTFFCLIFGFSLISAQQSLTFANDMYSGISAAYLAPTQPFLNPNPWDINVTSEDAFLQNDYGYISKQSILGLLNSEVKTANPKKNITGENTANVFDYYNKDIANIGLASEILGPSFSFSAKIADKKYVFGAFTSLRTNVSGYGIDNFLRFVNMDAEPPVEYSVQPFSLKIMNWAEGGINLATEIFPYSDKKWVIGANLKYEMGLDAAVISNNKVFTIRSVKSADPKVKKDDTYASDFDVSAGYITNYDFDNGRYSLKQNGRGIGLDFGIAILDRDASREGFDSKISFNILDLGYVDFREGSNHLFRNEAAVWLQNNPDFKHIKFDNPEQFLRIISKNVYGNEFASFAGNGFRIGLPTALNLGYQLRLKENNFLSFSVMQRLPIFENSLKRNNFINANYSVQKAAVGFGISGTFSEYRDVHFGGYFRFGPLVVGSENALPLLFRHQKLHAANIYFALKINPFWDNDFKRHRRQRCYCEN